LIEQQKIAVLLTCYNRKAKTIACLSSLYNCIIPDGYSFTVYLVDDGSTDGTANAIRVNFPDINIFFGNGNLFWAGGMRYAWREAMQHPYAAYLLLNDDVELKEDVFKNLIDAHQFAMAQFNKGGIYVSSTIEKTTGSLTYGGSVIKKGFFRNKIIAVNPAEKPIPCQVANANILFVSANVVAKLGIFDAGFIHSIADYDYTLTAYENNFPLLVCPGVGGYCENDHDKNWLSSNSSLKERIKYLYSPKGLAFTEYMYYIYKHFPLSLPYLFVMQWLKTLFPTIWDKLKAKTT
jgi:GT2 family glycosyltransferase